MSENHRVRARRVLTAALRRRPRELLLFGLWSALEAAPVLVFGRAVAGATDAFLAHRIETALVWLGILAVAAMAGALGAARAYGPLAAIVEPLRDALVRHVVRGAVHESVRTGRPGDGAVARLTQQVEIVRDTFAGLLMIVQGFVFTLFSALIGLLTLMPVTLALVAPPVVAGLALFLGLVSRSITRQRELILAEERIAESATAMAAGLRDITACGSEEAIAASAGRLIDLQAAAARSMARLAAGRTVALAIGGRLPLLLILAAAPWLVRHGATPGVVLGSLTYVLQGLSPALNTIVRGLGGSGLRLAVTLDRVMEAASVAPVTRPVRPAGGELCLRGVSFAYGPDAEPVIDDLSLRVPEGDHLAVVGPSGIGKSTLSLLGAGLLTPALGRVTLGDVPAGEADPDSRVLIPQEAYVFGGTLRENLRYLRPGASDHALDRAAAAVGLGKPAERLGGWDSEVDPATLSAGQRQLIALTRAYLSPARLIILDEATCHLDARSEERAERAFAARPGALIVIAHRMTSARRARRVLVLDGTRAWLGTHEDLLAGCDLYRELHGHWSAPQPAGDASA
ncbi:ABC transporter ATP-binding protein [Actinomadura sp. DC4]|uniref:ATP-binding cassette domain-containing protein n=1 Tax=Actinomadura sp. DC4 TaxID=3055069 RepID=UPI0025AF7FEE|nr:ABC transporter ATP-binding protein [Actinomadura sp. DC4]MDN3356908.1 ABC transporter ATP-binding protein [Actinomadura sp. DC4]